MIEGNRPVAARPPFADGSWAASTLFAGGLATVAANGALYFFGVDALSHPAVSVLGLALLVPLYRRKR